MKTSANVSNEKIMQWSHTPWSKIKTFTKNFFTSPFCKRVKKAKTNGYCKAFSIIIFVIKHNKDRVVTTLLL